MTEVLNILKSFRSRAAKITAVLSAILVALTFNLSLEWTKLSGTDMTAFIADFCQSFTVFNLATLILIPFMAVFFYICIGYMVSSEKRTREIVCSAIPAAMFAFFMVFGYSFYRVNSYELVTGNRIQIAKSLFASAGYFVLFFFCIIFIFHALNNWRTNAQPYDKKHCRPVQWYLDTLVSRPFTLTFLTLLIAYIPLVVISYPGIYTYDFGDQICQLADIEKYTPFLELINEDVKIFNNHPVAHTVLVYLCMRIGHGIFGSWNVGVFVYTTIQVLCTLATAAYMNKFLIKEGFARKYCVFVIIWHIIHPRIQNMILVGTKDILYADALVFFIISLYLVFTKKPGKRKYVMLGLSALGILLTRHDGVYIIALAMIIAFIIQKGFRKKCAIIAVAALCFNFMWNSVLLPAFEITPGSRREMLSIPFQQTARYVRDAPDDITEEEKAAISAVLDFDTIGEVYNPVLSDPVKVTFNEDCTSEELMEYFKVWFKMLWKHPGIYIQATMNNKYEMFYPSAKMFDYFSYATAENRMNMYNNYYDQTDFDFHYPDTFTTQRNNYELLREKIYRLPILSTMMIPAAYTWTMFVWLFYCIRKKNNTSISLMLPLFVQMLIIIAGPCNGSYIRYLYPYIICVPLLIFISNKLMNKDASEKEERTEAVGE